MKRGNLLALSIALLVGACSFSSPDGAAGGDDGDDDGTGSAADPKDPDGDGVAADDNCPEVAGPASNNFGLALACSIIMA